MAAGVGDRRVVVTGMGIVSPLGITLDDVASSLQEGKSGISFSEDHAHYGLKSQVVGRPPLSDDELKELIPRKALRFIGPNAQYMFISLERAIADAGLEEKHYAGNPRCANITGQGGTSMADIAEADEAMQKHGPWADNKWGRKMGPYRVTRTMGSASSAVLSSWFKIQGPSYSLSAACSTGAHCIGHGMEQIQLDKVDISFVGAGEEIGWEFSSMFDAMGSLSSNFNETPSKASRPLDKNGDGFVFAGGGGMLVLEELEHAKARGAKIYAELVGYGSAADGFDVLNTSGVGCERSMRIALEMADSVAGAKPVDYVNMGATGVRANDEQEAEAVKRLFAEKGYRPYVGSTKSLSGNALAAAGVHEAIYALLMINGGFLARLTNVDDPIDAAQDMNLLVEGYSGPLQRVMLNSVGFGGTNASLVFDKWTGS